MSPATQMSEEQVEESVERMTNRLDARLMAGKLSQADYDKAIRDLSHWADAQSCCAQIWDRVRWSVAHG